MRLQEQHAAFGWLGLVQGEFVAGFCLFVAGVGLVRVSFRLSQGLIAVAKRVLSW